MNGFSFTIGFGSTSLPDAFRLAFNFGATYTYSVTSTTTQSLSQVKPQKQLASCGYWTFLPYYVR